MGLQKLELQGLRGFAEPQELSFAIPDGEQGSGLTILVGPNNGGKSTVVEALQALSAGSPYGGSQPRSFTEGRRNKLARDRITIRATDTSGSVGGIRTVASGGSETEWFPSKLDKNMFVLPSRRYFNPLFDNGGVTSRDSYIASYGVTMIRGASLNHFAYRLFLVQQNREEFDAVLGEVLKPVPKWTIDQAESGQYYLKLEKGGQYHSSEGWEKAL